MTKSEILKELLRIGFTNFEHLQKDKRDEKIRMFWTCPISNHSDWFSVLIVEEDNFKIESLNNPLGKLFNKSDILELLDYINKVVMKNLAATEHNKVIKIFNYLEELDCFVVDPHYKQIADTLGLTEWNEVVWIGRFFLLDNDYGEHWFDNWILREPLEAKAEKLGLDITELFILDPDRFKNDKDGPCHTPEERILFWKDVLISMELSYETLFREARKLNEERKKLEPENYVENLEEKIQEVRKSEPKCV